MEILRGHTSDHPHLKAGDIIELVEDYREGHCGELLYEKGTRLKLMARPISGNLCVGTRARPDIPHYNLNSATYRLVSTKKKGLGEFLERHGL